MIDAAAIRALVETYQKHGWILRRILISPSSKYASEAELARMFETVDIVSSNVDAAWFSRPPKQGGVAWELRYLGDIPYALVEEIDENTPDRDEKMAAVEAKLIDAIAKKRSP